MNKDEKEKNLRMILNFGHTFGHGFEGAKNFSNKLNHGEAVLLGMMMASKFSYSKKILSLNELNLIKKHYTNLKLPMNINKIFSKKDVNKIVKFAARDLLIPDEVGWDRFDPRPPSLRRLLQLGKVSVILWFVPCPMGNPFLPSGYERFQLTF